MPRASGQLHEYRITVPRMKSNHWTVYVLHACVLSQLPGLACREPDDETTTSIAEKETTQIPAANDRSQPSAGAERKGPTNLSQSVQEVNLGATGVNPADLPPEDVDPEAMRLYESGSDLFLTENRFSEGARRVRQALELDPRIPDAYNVLFLYDTMVLRDHAKALLDMRAGAEHCTTSPAIHFSLGNAYAKEGQFEQAAAAFTKAIQLGHDKNASLFYNLGNALAGSRRFEEAETSYLSALSQDPRHLNAIRALALLYYTLERVNEARAEAQKLIDLDPGGSHGTWALEALKRMK